MQKVGGVKHATGKRKHERQAEGRRKAVEMSHVEANPGASYHAPCPPFHRLALPGERQRPQQTVPSPGLQKRQVEGGRSASAGKSVVQETPGLVFFTWWYRNKHEYPPGSEEILLLIYV